MAERRIEVVGDGDSPALAVVLCLFTQPTEFLTSRTKMFLQLSNILLHIAD